MSKTIVFEDDESSLAITLPDDEDESSSVIANDDDDVLWENDCMSSVASSGIMSFIGSEDGGDYYNMKRVKTTTTTTIPSFPVEADERLFILEEQRGDDDDDDRVSCVGDVREMVSEFGERRRFTGMYVEVPARDPDELDGEGERVRRKFVLCSGGARRCYFVLRSRSNDNEHLRKLVLVAETLLKECPSLALSIGWTRLLSHPRRVFMQARVREMDYKRDIDFYEFVCAHREELESLVSRELMCSSSDGVCWYWKANLAYRLRNATPEAKEHLHCCAFGCCRDGGDKNDQKNDNKRRRTTTTRRRQYVPGDERVRMRVHGRRVCLRRLVFTLYLDEPPPLRFHMSCGKMGCLEESEDFQFGDAVFRDCALAPLMPQPSSTLSTTLFNDPKCYNSVFTRYHASRQRAVEAMEFRLRHDVMHVCMNPSHMVPLCTRRPATRNLSLY